MSDLSERPGRLLLPALASPGSHALLIGTGSHPDGSALPSVPAVAGTLTDLGQLLVERCGLDEQNLVVVRDPADSMELGLTLADQAEQAEDVLFVYYVGHGLVSPGGGLHLATRYTDRRANRLSHTALAYAGVRDCLLSSPARSIVVVLDCCYSGRVIGTLGPAADEGTEGAGTDGEAAQLARVHGAYVLTSTGGEERALAPPGQPHTALSGELIALLREGEPDAPAYLTLRDLYRGLDRRLRARGFPRPSQQVSGWAEDLVLAPNPAYVPPQRRNGRKPASEASRQPPALSGVCPCPGLASFGAGDSQWYRGREPLTSALAERLGEQTAKTGPLFVLGPSGSGKSSLLRAGLLPALASGAVPVAGSRTWPHVLLTPSATPVRSLATALSAVTGGSCEELADRLTADPSALAAVVHGTMRARGGGAVTGARMVLLVDQFEELFTQCESESEREAFVRALCAAAASPAPGQEPSALMVLSVGSDFYDRCARIAELREALEGGQVVVGPMSVPELRAAIQQPADAVGLSLEPGPVELLLTDFGAVESTGADGTPADTAHDPDPDSTALPLLAHALLTTWERRDADGMTVDGYRSTGGIQGAVAATAERTVDRLDAEEQACVRDLMLRTVRLWSTDTSVLTLRPDAAQYRVAVSHDGPAPVGRRGRTLPGGPRQPRRHDVRPHLCPGRPHPDHGQQRRDGPPAGRPYAHQARDARHLGRNGLRDRRGHRRHIPGRRELRRDGPALGHRLRTAHRHAHRPHAGRYHGRLLPERKHPRVERQRHDPPLGPRRRPGEAPHLRRGGALRRPGPLAQTDAGRSPPHAVFVDIRRHKDRRSRPEAPLPGPDRPMTCLRTVTGAAPPSRKRCNCGRGQ